MAENLDADYATWAIGALALGAEIDEFIEVSAPLVTEARYMAWYTSALEIALAILDATEEWDTGVQDDDLAAILAGNAAMENASDFLPAFNAEAAKWEGECR